MPRASALAAALWLAFAATCAAQDAPHPATAEQAPGESHVEPASDDARQALAQFRVPEGLTLELFAAEPLLANPVAFDVDGRGRFYVVETFRHSAGVTDNRSHMNWLDADLASRTVEDRVAMYRKFLSPEEFAGLGVMEDRIRRIVDADGDGAADSATVFAGDFRGQATGLAAGVLAHGEDVYFTCIPDLWLLRDADGDGAADERNSLHNGYGVHVAFLGHDLHGLTLGPDGRLYFSIGDRGFTVRTKEGTTLAVPDSGSVLRCELDGSNLEVFATGLRNPQELAFDESGNLFTVDNNSDSGDRARLVHVVEGSDNGWRMAYQYIERPVSRGPWNAEQIWYPASDKRPAYAVPPVANISDGPSGLAYNPGTGLGEAQRGRFFLADFRGSANSSGVRSFAVKPKGAGFELADQGEFLWSFCATDVGFGPDGALYVTDWVNGWDKTGKGRIYRLVDPAANDEPIKKEVQRLLAEGMAGRPVEELARLLGHADQRIRLRAQYELAARSTRELSDTAGSTEAADRRRADATVTLGALAAKAAEAIAARRHAIWGLGQVERARSTPGNRALLVELLGDRDAEVRLQAARVLGDLAPASPSPDAVAPLVRLLKDADPRVRFASAIALGKLRRPEALTPILGLIRENDGQDAYLRHAGIMGMVGTADPETLAALAGDDSVEVRLAAAVALRRKESEKIASFLHDADPKVVTEAARAINDLPIDSALDRLAALPVKADTPDPLARRIINANARSDSPESPRRLATIAANRELPGAVRADALEAILAWTEPGGKDRITGQWKPVPAHEGAFAVAALGGVIDPILAEAPDEVRRAAISASASLNLGGAGERLGRIVAEAGANAETRVAALRALDDLDAPALRKAAEVASADPDDRLRAAALPVLARIEPAKAVAAFAAVLAGGSTAEKQAAYEALGDIPRPEADALLAERLDALIAGKVEPAVQLELLEAAAKRQSPEVKAGLARYETSLPKDDPLAAYRVALEGGDLRRGFRVFREKAELSCLRCHKVRGNGGEVGPDLTNVAREKGREYVLESIVNPNAKIAEGFETVVVATSDGQVVAGVPKGDDGKVLKLMTPEAKLVEIAKDDIEDQKRGDSAMPADLITKMTKSELRDLVEFLSRSR
jgi:quinoprotein glucose dehydrogenase